MIKESCEFRQSLEKGGPQRKDHKRGLGREGELGDFEGAETARWRTGRLGLPPPPVLEDKFRFQSL